jgi:NADH pyrophosphatase NudC (nudix superfamily)
MSWEQLVAIEQEARQQALDAISQPPTACPLCGFPLEPTEDSAGLTCPFLPHYTYPQDGHPDA